MALTGLDIFKLLPKTNCKECGFPTCLAFAMQLAQKKVKLDDCPYASEEAKEMLASAAAPPMRLIKFGTGDGHVQVGGETVVFRHEEKFHNPTVVTARVSDKLAGDELKKRVEAINALEFERVGLQIKVQAIAVVNDSGSPDSFASAAQAVAEGTGLAMILLSDSAEAVTSALEKVADKKPLVGWATPETAETVAKLAKEKGCPVIARADSIEALAELTEKIKSAGVEDIVLSPTPANMKEHFYNLTKLRILSLKKVFRPLGYPVLTVVPQGDDDNQLAAATALLCKYSNIVVLDTVSVEVVLPVLTAVMNIFTDPQKPVQVESKVYTVGEPGADAPVMFTTNFSLTYYTVESDVESARVPAYILVVDTEGTSVLTAYSGDKLNEKVVADAVKKLDLENLVNHKKLIIPGYVAVMSGKLEEALGWEILVGPRESGMIPKYLQEMWK